MKHRDNALKGKNKLWAQSATAVCWKKDHMDSYHSHLIRLCSYLDRIRREHTDYRNMFKSEHFQDTDLTCIVVDESLCMVK